LLVLYIFFYFCILYFTVCFSYWCNYHYYALLCTGQLLVHHVALLSFFIPSVFMLFCLISLHYVNGINKVMMMMYTSVLSKMVQVIFAVLEVSF